ncbi:gluconolactonase [Oscillatoriales cyanobacterium USR001]|nr:gluconolactonase [Oscillatoriales cyanobacterium USR001]
MTLFSDAPIALVPAHTITEFPINTFLESIVVGSDNTLFITSHYDGKIYRIGADKNPIIHAEVDGKATGLALQSDGSLLLSGWNAENISVVWQISTEGNVKILATMPDAIFLNGLTHLTNQTYLIADSYKGAIWELDATEGKVKVWLEHPCLARKNLENEIPAVNGIKIFGNFLYASNTQNAEIIKIPIEANNQPGEPLVFVKNANIDDFAFDIQGNLYGTTHVFNSVVKIDSNGDITTIAQAEEGMVGTTAVAFGKAAGDRTSLYVTTNGGMSFPPPTGLESGKVVRLDVGIEGLPIL